MTVSYEQERYSVEEEAGSVTLALVLDRAVPFNVTVTVNTLDLLDSSVGDAATGELYIGILLVSECFATFSMIICNCLHRTSIIRMTARL